MTIDRVKRLLVLAATLVVSTAALAQNYPARPVRIVVGFPPGGGFDVLSRLLAAKLPAILGQPVVLDNTAGAGGFIGAKLAASAPADGYTLFSCGVSTHGIGPAIYKNLPVDPEKDFVPISMVASNPNVLVVHPSVPVKNFAEFIAWAKAGGGKHAYASAGVGTAPHLAMEVLKQSAGIDLIGIHYKGDALAQQSVIAGHVPTTLGGFGLHLPMINAGMSRPIAVTSLKRHPSLPNVPTLDESGLPGLEVLSWMGVCAPAGTPEPVLDTLNAAVVNVLKQPDTVAQLVRIGWTPQPSTRAELGAFIHKEITRWKKVAQASGIALE
jgi:tripartite-type tricarboxylate transporter receptor subunit TctC